MTEAFVLRFHQSPITPMINTGIPKEKHQFTMSTTAGWKLQMAILTIPMMMMITRDKVDFCFSVAFGLYITLTGYVPDLLKSISMVSDKEELFGSGMCGKGHKEWVKVSDGGPYLKCKVRLG